MKGWSVAGSGSWVAATARTFGTLVHKCLMHAQAKPDTWCMQDVHIACGCNDVLWLGWCTSGAHIASLPVLQLGLQLGCTVSRVMLTAAAQCAVWCTLLKGMAKEHIDQQQCDADSCCSTMCCNVVPCR